MQEGKNLSLQNTTSEHSQSRPRMGWQFLHQFLLRQSGFPIEWLDELSSKDVADAAMNLLECYTAIQATRLRALQALRDILLAPSESKSTLLDQSLIELNARLEKWALVRPFVIQALSQDSICKDLVKLTIAWNADLKRLNTLQESCTFLYAQAVEQEVLCVLRRYGYDPRLKEVLLLSNEANFDLFDEWLESHKELTSTQSFRSKDRRMIDMLVMYLQRVCAKNETNSHFGPFALGQVVAERQGIQWDGEGSLQRIAYFAYWAANELARQMSHDSELSGWIRPRRIPYSFLEGNDLHILCYEHDNWFVAEELGELHVLPLRTLSLEETELLKMCDGERTIQDLFIWWQKTRSATTFESFRMTLGSLEHQGSLVVAFEVPTGTIDALGDLRKLLPLEDKATAPWVEVLDTLKSTLQQFAVAEDIASRRRLFTELNNRFTGLTGVAPTRGFGQTYADRSILYEECCRDLHTLSVGGQLADAVKSELSLFYDLKQLIPRYELAAQQRMLNDWFIGRYGTGQQLSVAAFLRALSADASLLEDRYTAIDIEIGAIRKMIDDKLIPQSSINDAVVEVTPEVVEGIVNFFQLPLPAVCNPDIMVIAPSLDTIRAGKFQVIVADWHACELLSHTSLSPFFAQAFPHFANDVITLYRGLLEQDEQIVDVIRYHTDKISAQITLACPDLEVRGRSPKPRDNILTLEDLIIHQTSKGLRLYAPKLHKFVRLMSQDIFAWSKRNPLNIFGFPRNIPSLVVPGIGRSHIPRIVMNKVVIQRELWRIPTDSFVGHLTIGHRRLGADTIGEFLLAKDLQRTLNLPRYGFVKIPKEPKPIYVDFDAPLLTRQLVRLARQVQGTVEFSEMLPGHADLWLNDSVGHYTSEFRFAAFSSLKHKNRQESGEA